MRVRARAHPQPIACVFTRAPPTSIPVEMSSGEGKSSSLKSWVICYNRRGETTERNDPSSASVAFPPDSGAKRKKRGAQSLDGVGSTVSSLTLDIDSESYDDAMEHSPSDTKGLETGLEAMVVTDAWNTDDKVEEQTKLTDEGKRTDVR